MASTYVHPFAVELDRSGPYLTAYVTGDLDMATGPRLTGEVTEALDDRVAQVRIDLSSVTFCDSGGLRAFLAIHREAAQLEAVVTIQDPPVLVRRMLTVVGMDEVIPVLGITRRSDP